MSLSRMNLYFLALLVQSDLAPGLRIPMAIDLAKRAAVGQLGQLQAQQPVNVLVVPVPVHPADFCADRSTFTGQVLGPDGPYARCSAGDRGLLRNTSGVLYPMSHSQKIWIGVDEGALTFLPD